MIPSAVLGKYARSLAEIVFEEKIEEAVTGDLKTYREIFRAVPDLLQALDSPALPRETKIKLLSELAARYPVNPVTSNFLHVLLQNNRIRYFQEVFDIYIKSVNEHRGVISALVTAAAPLNQQEVKDIEDRLAAMMQKMVKVEIRTDASLLGGITVQIGSTSFDGSIRTRLAEIRRRLAEN